MLKVGSKAPSFSLESTEERKISLREFEGKTVVLYFYPKDMTSGCTQQACDFRDSFAQFKKLKAVVLGVSKDSVDRHLKFQEKENLTFTLLSDPTGEVCEKYGVWKEKSMYGRKYMGIERTTFIISPDGRIQKIYEKVKVKEHIQTILSDLES